MDETNNKDQIRTNALFRIGLIIGDASKYLNEEEMADLYLVLLNHIPMTVIDEYHNRSIIARVAEQMYGIH